MDSKLAPINSHTREYLLEMAQMQSHKSKYAAPTVSRFHASNIAGLIVDDPTNISDNTITKVRRALENYHRAINWRQGFKYWLLVDATVDPIINGVKRVGRDCVVNILSTDNQAFIAKIAAMSVGIYAKKVDEHKDSYCFCGCKEHTRCVTFSYADYKAPNIPFSIIKGNPLASMLSIMSDEDKLTFRSVLRPNVATCHFVIIEFLIGLFILTHEYEYFVEIETEPNVIELFAFNTEDIIWGVFNKIDTDDDIYLEQIGCNWCLGCIENAMKVCSKCQQVHYCSAECQRADWTYHKKECNLLGQP